MHKLNFLIQIIAILLLFTNAYSLSSSSYLISNSAMLLFDYEEAKIHYDNSNLNDFNNNDLEKKLLAFIITNSIDKGAKVAKEILKKDKTNQEAWLVYLVDAKLNNFKSPFSEFQREKQNENLNIVDFIFFNGSQQKKNNNNIAKSIFDIVQTSTSQDKNKLQNYDYLLFYLSLSLNLNEFFNEAYFYSAQIYQGLKKYNKAEQLYNKVNKDHLLYLESQKNIAINKRYQKKIKDAENGLITLIKTYPENKSLLISLADLYRTSKQYKKAIIYYSKILNNLNIDKNNEWKMLYMRGICYERINNWQLAEEDFLRSLDINSESPQVLNYLAYGWLERNIFLDKSLKMLKTAHEKHPESHYILDSLAWAYFKKNNLKLASKLMEEVLSQAPGEAISLDHLGDIYLAMGRKREALYMWRQAKDLAEHKDNIIDSVVAKLEKHNAG